MNDQYRSYNQSNEYEPETSHLPTYAEAASSVYPPAPMPDHVKMQVYEQPKVPSGVEQPKVQQPYQPPTYGQPYQQVQQPVPPTQQHGHNWPGQFSPWMFPLMIFGFFWLMGGIFSGGFFPIVPILIFLFFAFGRGGWGRNRNWSRGNRGWGGRR